MDAPSANTPSRSRLWRHVALTATLLIVGVIGAGIWMVVRAVNHELEAEDRLQVSRFVCDLIADHVDQSPTHTWPTSWADLEGRTSKNGESINSWPSGSQRVRSLVTIEFTTSVPAVLKQTPETCTAISVTPGPNYAGIPNRWFYDLYDRLRATTSTPEPVPPESKH